MQHLLFSAARKPGNWAALVAAVFCAVSLITLNDYGVTWDEPAGMFRGEATVGLMKAVLSGGTVEFQFNDAHYHPAAYATSNFLLSKFLTGSCGWKPLPAWHLLNVLTASAGLLILFHLGKHMFNARVGLAAVLFMVFFPRFVAHAHFNAKDVPVMVFSTLTLLLLVRAAQTNLTRQWILAGLGFAWTTTTKLNGLLLLPIFFIPWFLTRTVWKTDRPRADYGKVAWFFYTSVFFIFLMWPVLWVRPGHLFESVSNFAGQFKSGDHSAYLGQDYPVGRMPWHYLPMHLLAVTPVISLFAAGMGVVGSARHFLAGRARFEHLLLWHWLVIPLLAGTLPGTMKYDGMRHVFLAVPAMALFAGLFVDRVLSMVNKMKAAALLLAVLCSLLAWLGWQTIESHPNQGSYLNEAVRLAIPREKLGRYFDFYGWGSTYKQAVDWLNAHAPLHSSLAFGHNHPSFDYEQRSDLVRLSDGQLGADFTIVSAARRDLRQRFNSSPVFSVQCYGADLILIYSERPEAGQAD